MIDALSSEKLPKPKFRYSPLVKAGPYYKTAGMIALDASSGVLVTGGVYAETKKILTNLMQALSDFGLALDALVGSRIFTTRFDEFS